MGILGKKVSIVECSDPNMVGLKGTILLESMHMLSMSTEKGTLSLPKLGTAVRLEKRGELVICDEIVGRLEDRLARGSRY